MTRPVLKSYWKTSTLRRVIADNGYNSDPLRQKMRWTPKTGPLGMLN